MEIFSVKDLSFTYPQKSQKALDNINLNINSGEFTVICGESGCGKTTLLRLFKRELSPKGKQEGDILYNGVELNKLDERTSVSEIGFVMQNPENQTIMHKVCYELAFGVENIGLPSDMIQRRIGEMASFFGLQNIFNSETSQLSGGQKQLVNLASVMVMQPKIIILDEPTSQLDPIATKDFISILERINKELGITVIIAEHNLEEVFSLADKVIVIEKGKIISQSNPRDVCDILMSKDANHNMIKALPTPVKIYSMLRSKGECPLTVKEGRNFLEKSYKSDIKELPTEEYTHTDSTIIELKNVWYRYERNSADILKGVNLKIYKQEIFSLLGGNGTGKTTLLSVISGINKAYRGSVTINNKKIKDYKGNSLYLHNLAFLPQNPQTVFIEDTVRNDFNEVCKTMGYSKSEKDENISYVADKLNITHLLENHPYDLSGGEQQKCAIAKMLLLKPKILLMDEPSKSLDAFAKENLGNIIKSLKDDGITIFTVTHDIEFACEYSTRVALFFDGDVVSCNIPSKFFPENAFYTTSANRMARHIYPYAVKCSDVVELCKRNGKKI